MNFPGFHTLSSAWFFLLLIPLVILYFLKLRRPRHEVPSLALWRQVINDQRVNSPFQKFKRNISLLLQVLLLSLLVLAGMQPFLRGDAERADYIPVIVDCSASMAALDKPGGVPRIDVAREELETLIDNLLPDQRLQLIAMTGTARRLTEFTDNKRILREALDRLEVTDVAASPEDALRMAQATARSVPVDRTLIVSDGNIPERVDVELPFELDFRRLEPGGTNAGITELNARRSGTGEWDVFVRVAASSGSSAIADVQLFVNGELQDTRTVILDAGSATESSTGRGPAERLAFTVRSQSDTSLELRLVPDGFDSLAGDNVAWLHLPAARPLVVVCPPEFAAWRHALRGISDVQVFPRDDDDANDLPTVCDVLITGQPASDTLPDATVTVFVGIVPDDLEDLIRFEPGMAQIVDWDRSAPLLQHVQLNDVQILDRPVPVEGIRNEDFEKRGYQILIHAANGPLVLKRREGATLFWHLLFHTDRSTLPWRVGFPVMVANILQTAMQMSDLGEVRAPKTGVLPAQILAADREYRIELPGGDQQTATSDAHGLLTGISAARTGRYTIRDGSETVAIAGVSLLNADETSLRSVETIQFPEMTVATSAPRIQNDRPLWYVLVLIAFVVLLVEWWFFQRRPGQATA